MKMLNTVRNILEDYTDIPRDEITEETSLTADLEINSYELVNLVLAFEEHFGVQIPDRDISELLTVGDIITYINKNSEGK